MEETPLLVMEESTSEADYMAVKSFKDVKFVLRIETVKLWKIAAPMALSSLFNFLTISSLNIYAGHLGDIVLSSISLYFGVISAIYFTLLVGMSSALATLCGQAYGAGQIQSTRIYVQRSWIVLVMTCIILLPTHIYATEILKFLGQDKEIANLAGKYAMQAIPTMFSYAIVFPIQRFLQAQSKSLVVYVAGWCKEGWSGFSWLAFKDLWPFTWLSLSLSLMNCLEQWNGTFIVLLAGQLDNPTISLASYNICFNICGWYTMLMLGVNTAISVRISNTLGMSHPRAAKYSFYVTMSQSLFIGILFLIFVLLSKEHLALIFTNSEDMIRAVCDLAYLLAVAILLSSLSQVISGVATGCGWQVMVGYINLACYYILGLSLGYFLGFIQHLGVKGLWGGTLSGSIIQILVITVIIWRTNWTKQVEQTANRMQKWSPKGIRKEMI
ncbi:hypothetical protein AHAS_Ahas05G0296400 [Arachis hypogaea]